MNDKKVQSRRPTIERGLPTVRVYRSLLWVLGILLTLVALMEVKARYDNYPVNYPFSPDAWVHQWYRLDELPKNQTLFLGASRVRHGLIIDQWHEQTGNRPLSLAWPGAKSLPVLEELAQRESFRGTVICGIAPLIVFAADGPPWLGWMDQNIRQAKMKRLSLSYHLSQASHHFIRPRIKMANSAAYSPISNMYFNFPVENRKGLIPPLVFRFIGTTDAELQDKYLESFEKDAELKKLIVEQLKIFNQRQLFYGVADFDDVIKQYKDLVDTIEQRGGNVVFVRLPSDGWIGDFEAQYYPREDCYDRLIEETGCFGVHYRDYPVLREMKCVEESHLSVGDGIVFTTELIKILRNAGELE